MDPRTLSAQELLQLCLESGDEAAWEEFVRRFQPTISGVVVKSIRRWSTPTPALAEDLVQETYLKLCASNFKALRRFVSQHENALFGFLKVVASNVVQDHFRRTRNIKRGSGREEQDFEDVKSSVISVSGSSDHTERAILITEIRQCLEKHSAEPNFARDCTIFWLYYRQGLTAKAISELPSINLTVEGVESALLRLTRMLREELAEKPTPPVPSHAREETPETPVTE